MAAAEIIVLVLLTRSAPAQEPDLTPKAADSEGFLSRIWLSGQINIIAQGHPSFRSPYSGQNSFQASSEIQTSRVLTLYTGLRLNDRTDVLCDLETTNGKDLSGGKGLAGFTNLDLAGVPNTHPYVARALVHRLIPLSEDTTETDRGPLQLTPKVPARRLELYAGKMSLLDFFDVNVIGSDSHYQFLNWTVDNNAPYGYPADTRGYTYAFLTEYHDRAWTLRFAEALTPRVNNPDQLDVNLAQSRSENIEIEVHHKLLPERDGAIRVLNFVDHGMLGDYREAIQAYRAGIDPSPDITAHRAPGQIKYGFGLNLEQEINGNLRAFGRFGWAEGHKESLAFTEANQSISGGFDLRGKLWRRADDKLGVAFVSNALSDDHREYLALGGLGVLLGDGKLNYGREGIFEIYYTLKLWRGVYAAADLQRIWNPGYNRDRGPVLVPAVRLHLEGALFNSPR